MKFSACTAAFGMADLKKIIDTSAKLGYDAVELTAALHLPVESTPERRKEVLGWIHDAGIVCSALHYIFRRNHSAFEHGFGDDESVCCLFETGSGCCI